ncbi:rhodanese-like domain-containing protein [Flavilitoribacter nigricans]|uniref:Sulfurtransferase n=1 Tax=Flavilitoribacter nigricans (strain ATCC 23147 / DSM 23189 / NBRC 102662 / NCIMB 1420 / SS-2) TaxID=1122177 RepID=A0A2D0NGJ9_FLAN2|nr:rhodanese-like domain-containing protein [Flavilitoribacter nigricans]PHN07621.1 sulfurtransferase [Flavilitoribacter nigricans DSM 23189 = NBRC 102662]
MDLQSIVKQPNTTLIDVREPFEFATHHVQGAVNIPLQTIPKKMDELRELKGPIVLYCRSGNRSGMATKFLQSHGFQEVYNGGSVTAVEYFLLPDASNV